LIPESEIVTGERVQALGEVTLLPRMIARRRRGPSVPVREVIEFETHRDLDEGEISRLSWRRSIFVYSDALALFQAHIWPRLKGSDYVLITHNSDAEVGAEQSEWLEQAGEKLRHWFAQNVLIEHPKLSPVPIGLANAEWEHGDLGLVSRTARARAGAPRLLHAHFNLGTHPDRRRAWEAVKHAFPDTPALPPSQQPFADYLRELARHQFCICPRGNGVDTHRFWECQYLGVVPVVERSPHTERWAREGLPMVLLDDWSELSRERLEAEPPRPTRPAACLRLSYYAKRIRQCAASELLHR
jgi:hypothetical protein